MGVVYHHSQFLSLERSRNPQARLPTISLGIRDAPRHAHDSVVVCTPHVRFILACQRSINGRVLINDDGVASTIFEQSITLHAFMLVAIIRELYARVTGRRSSRDLLLVNYRKLTSCWRSVIVGEDF